jgi:hypothetical protein
MNDEAHALGKALWTDADFDVMGWHDATIHAIAFEETDDRAALLLDLDYVVRWIEPQPPSPGFSFLVAPATLVFENVWSLDGDVNAQRTLLGITDLHRLEAETDRQRNAGVRPWRIEGQDFEWRFFAAGFHQHFRGVPCRSASQRLSTDERGGISFAQPTAFTYP